VRSSSTLSSSLIHHPMASYGRINPPDRSTARAMASAISRVPSSPQTKYRAGVLRGGRRSPRWWLGSGARPDYRRTGGCGRAWQRFTGLEPVRLSTHGADRRPEGQGPSYAMRGTALSPAPAGQFKLLAFKVSTMPDGIL
jgi:hypothetical protein